MDSGTAVHALMMGSNNLDDMVCRGSPPFRASHCRAAIFAKDGIVVRDAEFPLGTLGPNLRALHPDRPGHLPQPVRAFGVWRGVEERVAWTWARGAGVGGHGHADSPPGCAAAADWRSRRTSTQSPPRSTRSDRARTPSPACPRASTVCAWTLVRAQRPVQDSDSFPSARFNFALSPMAIVMVTLSPPRAHIPACATPDVGDAVDGPLGAAAIQSGGGLVGRQRSRRRGTTS
jgi:hypothetical protein